MIVSEEQIALAILRLIELQKSVVEGAAATTLAACMSGKIEGASWKACGSLALRRQHRSNVLSRVIESGLVADGRLGRFTAVISDHRVVWPSWLRKSLRLVQASSKWYTIALSPARMSRP